MFLKAQLAASNGPDYALALYKGKQIIMISISSNEYYRSNLMQYISH